jgi:hypothetical protein
MRFKVAPFTHPDYGALKLRSEFWAIVWGMGHLFFVLYLAIACAMPALLAIVALIDADILRGRILDVGGASVTACLLIAGLGFTTKRYATKKSRENDA